MILNKTQINKGFSFMEALVVIAACLILFLITANAFSRFRDSQILSGSAEEINVLISKARSETLASKNFSQHGIHFENDKIVVFEGAAFSPSDPKNQETKISNLIEIFSISLNGGGSDLIFQKLTGETNQYGAISLRLKNNLAKTKTITVEATGNIKTQ